MSTGIVAAGRARYRLTLLTVFLIVIAPASSLSVTAATVAASARLSQSAQSDDFAEVKRLNDEVARLYGKGKYDEAIPLAEQALAIYEKNLGPDHPQVATSLDSLAELYWAKGDYAKAEPLYQRALAIKEKALGPEHPNVANSLNTLALLYYRKRDYAKAEPLYQRALAIYEKALGPEHPNVANSLNNLAGLYDKKGDYAKAEPLYQRALAIREKVLGPDHPDVASSLNNLAALYKTKGDYAKAEPLYRRALAIKEKALGPEHPNVANCLGNLAVLYDAKGDYAKAEPLFLRALAILEKALGSEHPGVALTLNNLAALYDQKGDYAKAEPLYQRALAIQEKALGPNHPDVALSVNNLAGLYYNKGDYAKAETLFQRALAIYEKALGPDHPDVGPPLNNLAQLYRARGDYAKAEPLYQRALAIRKKALGPDHPDVALSLNRLAGLYDRKGDYANAELLYQQALEIQEKALGPDHPDVALSLNSLAGLYDTKGDVTRAVAFLLRATDISERNIALNLTIGSERQKLLYLATFADETDRTISLHIQSAPNDQAARRLALTTILRRKGRALDAAADGIAALRRRLNPQDRELLDQLTDLRSRLATLVLGGPGKTDPAQYRAAIKRLEEQAEKLEAQISTRSAEFRVQSQPVTLESVQAAIPPGAALVEFVSYTPYNAKKHESGSRRYVAYVLSNQSEPVWVDLGEASEIDKDVNELRAVLRKDEDKPLSDIEREVKPKARLLDQKIMQPVRKLLGDKRQLLLSPDGALNLIPFATLVDEQGKYLIESYSLTYLTTGRDLLRLQTRMESQQGATVFANPDFGGNQTAGSGRAMRVKPASNNTSPTAENGAPQNPSQAIDFSQAYFPALPGTAEEAQALKTIFPDAKVWTRRQATKTELKQVNAPAFLHIATHGFFLDDVVVSAAEAKSRGLFIRTNQPGEITGPEFHVEDPLLRSGLALAGANLHGGGGDDGILTAKEAAGLNLWGTKLVVLSACDTGVGEVKNGEGIYGLRRALVLAGSQTQVMSLWPVSDEGTRDLMIGYYKGLQSGAGRSEALRRVQLKMLASGSRKHPYYWASFIQSGEWANLDGKR
jgi:CHAT domain-containing protein/Flp pilus assembly protein TadD